MEEEETFTVHFKTLDRYDEFAQMSQTELACETESGSNWLFLDNKFVDATAVREMDLTQAVQPFRMVAALPGHPPDCPCLNRRTVQTYIDGDYQTKEIPTTNIFGDYWTVFVNGRRSSLIEYQDTEIPSDARIKRLPNIRPRRNRFKTKR